MARILLAAVFATALLIPSSAEAVGHHPHSAGTTHRKVSARRAVSGKTASRNLAALATAVAERYWGATPCNGQITVITDVPLAADLDPTTDGWVTFNSSLGANNLQAPASTYTQCTVSLAQWQWPTRAAIKRDWNMFCLTVVHELGHLLGHPHSLTPGSVMAAVFTDEANVPTICRTTRPSA